MSIFHWLLIELTDINCNFTADFSANLSADLSVGLDTNFSYWLI